jgi:dipeptidyl aminopeptidase/acylaminoacyl peptidase
MKSLCAVLWLGTLLAQATAAELPIETLLTAPLLPPLSYLSIAPDSGMVAYAVIDPRRAAKIRLDTETAFRTGLPFTAPGSDIWLTDVRELKHRNLTGGVGNNWSPGWSPDGQHLAFWSDRGGDTDPAQVRLWMWGRAADVLRSLGPLPLAHSQSTPLWTADGRNVIVKLRPQDMSREDYRNLMIGVSLQAPNTADIDWPTVKLYSFDPSAKDAAPRTNLRNPDVDLGDLALIDVRTGAVQRLTQGERIYYHALSPDGRMLAWLTPLAYAQPGSAQFISRLSVYDFKTATIRKLVDKLSPAGTYGQFGEYRFSWSPRSNAIAYQTGIKDDVYLVSLDGSVRHIADGRSNDVRPSRDGDLLWTRSGEYLVFVREGALWRAAADGSGAEHFAHLPGRQLRGIEAGSGEWWSPDDRYGMVFTFDPSTKKAGIARVNLQSGRVTQSFEENKHYGGDFNPPAVAPDRKAVLFVAEDAAHPRELWRAQAQGAATQISGVGIDLAGFELGRTGILEWRGIDGNVLRGALIYPAGYRAGKRYPLIVKVYGGAEVSNGLNTFGLEPYAVDNLQIFANRGYAVLYADSLLRVGTPMLDLLKSVLPGVDKAIEIGLADPERLGLMGHSYGGYSTLALITQTTRFKAAMASASIGDLPSAYGALRWEGSNYFIPWAEDGQGRMGGSPWEFRSRYIENSPVFYLDRVTTPLLIVNGGEDLAPWLADQVFSSLRRLGKRVEYARYAGEDHHEGDWSLANQKDYLTRVIAWFDRYLKEGI